MYVWVGPCFVDSFFINKGQIEDYGAGFYQVAPYGGYI